MRYLFSLKNFFKHKFIPSGKFQKLIKTTHSSDVIVKFFFICKLHFEITVYSGNTQISRNFLGGALSVTVIIDGSWIVLLGFKSWTRLPAYHIVLILLGKIWIQLFSLCCILNQTWLTKFNERMRHFFIKTFLSFYSRKGVHSLSLVER